MKIFSSQQIREADAYTIKHEPVASIDLMERAANACFDWIKKASATQKSFSVVCGNGNNGGDGLAIARKLLLDGFDVNIFIVAQSKKKSANFKTNLARLNKIKKAKIVYLSPNPSPKERGEKNKLTLLVFNKNEIIIDALFGTGLNKPVGGIYKKVIQHINNSDCEVVSIDMPSGLFADACSLKNADAIVRATHTLSFEFYKLAFMFAENAEFFGEVHILNIGLSEKYISETKSDFQITDKEKIKSIIKKRSPFSHKGNYGHALLIAGSNGKMGAAVLAAKACLRSGAGLLTIQVPGIGYKILQTAVPEAMCIIDYNNNYISETLDYTNYTTIGIGPGIDSVKPVTEVLYNLLVSFNKPIVIDADALNIISQNKTWLKKIPFNSILTPHPKEFERLFGKTKNNFERNKLQMECSKKHNVVIVLKGKYSCITSPSGHCFFNPTGNAGMAKGGSGDVLTGMLTALLAQGYSPFDAAIAGVYLHGLAGDFAAEKFGEYSVLAGDITEGIAGAMKKVLF